MWCFCLGEFIWSQYLIFIWPFEIGERGHLGVLSRESGPQVGAPGSSLHSLGHQAEILPSQPKPSWFLQCMGCILQSAILWP